MADVRKQIGNAVPPNGVIAIAKSLMPLFSGKYIQTDLEKRSAEFQSMTLRERLDLSIAV